jgi:NAD(P)-dependent dehydrogenase (short-subunit alcohol dehydrogenase family)
MGRLDNKVAVVTGAAMGIGKSTVLRMTEEGAKVVVADIDDVEGEATVAAIRAAGGEALFSHCDVGVTEDVQRTVAAAVERYGQLNVMVNNAGVAISGSADEISEDNWNKLLNIHLTGTWRGIRFALPHLVRAGGGSIVNMSSVQSIIGFQGWAGYAAAKGGINALTQQVAVDYGHENIRCNAIAPGTIMTPMNQKIFETTPNPEELIATWNSWHAIGRFGQPEEVADLIVFLASDESSFITGAIIKIDGGMSVKGC